MTTVIKHLQHDYGVTSNVIRYTSEYKQQQQPTLWYFVLLRKVCRTNSNMAIVLRNQRLKFHIFTKGPYLFILIKITR